MRLGAKGGVFVQDAVSVSENRGLSREGLKLLASVCMLIDHVGLTRFPGALWLRCVGRLAFPIYCFFLAQGFRHTGSRGRYLARLVLMALISEPAFDRMIYGAWFDPRGQNVLWTLALGLLAIWALSLVRGRGWVWIAGGLGAAALCCLAGDWLCVDYGSFGVALCLLLWAFWQAPSGQVLCAGAFLAMCWGWDMVRLPGTDLPMEIFGVLALPLLSLYRGRRRTGSRALQWAFYWFYPLHMLLLGLLF